MSFVRQLVAGSVLGVIASACTFNPAAPMAVPITIDAGNSSGAGGSRGTVGSAGSSGGGGMSGSTGRGVGTGGGAGDIGLPDAGNCGQVMSDTMTVLPDMLLILDKSGSMANDFTDTACPNQGTCMDKWTAMTTALTQVLTNTDATIRWGLELFPANGNDQCAVNTTPDVPIANNNAVPIQNAMPALPGGRTPTRVAVQNGVAYLSGLADQHPKYILLATDGLPNCLNGNQNGNAGNDPQGAIAAVAAALAAGFPTFVVGVGNVAGADTTLTAMAAAGGKAQATAPGYYPAASGTQLEAVLATIGGQLASCNFALTCNGLAPGQACPPDPTNIAVLGDTKPIPQDATNGWQYGPGMTSVNLVGSYCTQVKNQQIAKVDVIFGCPHTVIIVP